MDMITAAEVIRRIEWYFQGGALQYLTPAQGKYAAKAVQATRRNTFDNLRLNLHSARHALARRVAALEAYPNGYRGRGIVICGGGAKYFPAAWVCIHMLRHLHCTLPIQLWHLGPGK